MTRGRENLSEYKGMWLFTLFDLPVTTSEARKDYANFRKNLLKQGFTMLQYSVYARYCSDEDRGKLIKNRLKRELPPKGDVRFLLVTDRQFGKMEVFTGRKRVSTEKKPRQLFLF